MILEELRTLRWADYFILALTDPRALARLVRANDPLCLALSFVVPAVVSLVTLVALSLAGRQTGFFYYKITFGWALLWALLACRGVVAGALIEMASQFSGNQPAARETLALLNFSLLPQVFLLPLVQMTVAVRFAPVYFYSLFTVVEAITSAALSLWSVIIAVQALAELHQCTIGRAALLFFVPAILVMVLLFLAAVLGGAMLMGLAAG